MMSSDNSTTESSHIYEDVEPREVNYQQNFNRKFTSSSNRNFNGSNNNGTFRVNIPYKYALDIVPKFGGDNENLHEFINCCKEAREILATVNEKFLVTLFRNKMIGKAREAIASKTFDSLNEFYSYLKEIFLPDEGFVKLSGLLENIHQKDGEKVIEYTSRVESISKRFLEEGIQLFGFDSQDILKEKLLRKYIMGFTRDIRNAIKDEMTVENVRRKAILEEEQLKRDLLLRNEEK